MEYLEGETLASRLMRGALPLDRALKQGIAISNARTPPVLHARFVGRKKRERLFLTC